MLESVLQHCSDLSQLLDVFHMIFDANQVGVTIVRADGVIIYYNDAQARLDELSPADALGMPICDVYSYTPESSPTMKALRTGKPVFDSVHYYHTRHGKLVNSANSIYPLWARGRLLGAVCFIQSYTAIGRMVGYMRGADEDGKPAPAAARPAPPAQSAYSFASLIGDSPALREAAGLARRVAPSTSSVMLVGETGVGKEIFAQAMHYESPRRKKPYTAINCSAVPETLLEGILFGTARGAFTGAVNRVGLFEATAGGTLYLDEIHTMPVSLQNKLLRVLQEKMVRRVGEGHERPIDVRIISSVGGNPVDLVERGLLRPDFYYRLGVIRIQIPPLRSRREDIHPLVQHFLQTHSRKLGLTPPLVTPEAMAVFYSHAWPGNVRELEHAIEASLALVEAGENLEPAHLYRAVPDLSAGPAAWSRSAGEQSPLQRAGTLSGPSSANGHDLPAPAPGYSAENTERGPGRRPGFQERSRAAEAVSLEKALKAAAGNVAMAARLLGMSPQLLHYKMKKYSLDKRAFIPGELS